jgi:hypothetical protein
MSIRCFILVLVELSLQQEYYFFKKSNIIRVAVVPHVVAEILHQPIAVGASPRKGCKAGPLDKGLCDGEGTLDDCKGERRGGIGRLEVERVPPSAASTPVARESPRSPTAMAREARGAPYAHM